MSIRRRSNPWPALVDLFGALLIASFGGLMMAFSGQAKEEATTQTVQENSLVVIEKIKRTFSAAAVSSNSPLEPDAEVWNVTFPTGRYEEVPLTDEQVASIASQLTRFINPLGEKRAVQIVVEGHADTQTVTRPGEKYRDNWELSSRRAASLLAKLSNAGVDPNQYNIVSIGYGDTRPKCRESTEACASENRRAAIRVRIDPRFASTLQSLPREWVRLASAAK